MSEALAVFAPFVLSITLSCVGLSLAYLAIFETSRDSR